MTATFNKCLGCPRGRWGNALGSHNETAGCKDCAQGKYSDLEGMNSAEQCKGCPKGKWSEGKGVDKDDEKAVELWTKSAKQDNQVPRAYATQIMWSFGIFARVLRLTTERGSATRSDDQSV